MVEKLKQTFIHIKTPKGQHLSRQLSARFSPHSTVVDQPA